MAGGKDINRVFVYGTLMEGFRNYKKFLKGRINRIIPGKTHGLLYHLPEGYPALLEGKEAVEGEIMEPVDEKLLKALDRLEGYSEGRSGNLYVRVARNIMTVKGEEIPCWVYFYENERHAKEKGILVPGGNWRKFMEERAENGFYRRW
ncbi:MAG TPA: gamma-glutamylcyclotransferase [Clostridiaceae bacterium]|nr:gamma-glutamylcyclotransferase [Clostridiaceae bacterium]